MSKDITNFGSQQTTQIPNVLNLPPTMPKKREETTDEIKKAYRPSHSYSAYLNETGSNSYEHDYYHAVWENYLEVTPFYSKHLKTSFLTSINKLLSDNIIDSNTYIADRDGNKVETPVIDSYLIKLDRFTLEEIVMCGNLYGKCAMLIHIDNEGYIFDVIHPWRYTIFENKIKILFFSTIEENDILIDVPVILTRRYDVQEDGTYIVHDNYESIEKGKYNKSIMFRTSILPFHEVESERMFTDGAIELSLVYSTTWTSLYKDIRTGESNLFIDQKYSDKNGNINNDRINYTVLNGSTTTLPGEESKGLFEHVSPNLRSTDHETILNLAEARMATILNLPVSVISSSGATEANIIDSKTAKRFNKTKKLIMSDINKMFKSIGYQIVLEDYKNETKDTHIKTAVLLKSNGVGTQLPVLREIYAHMDEEWVYEEYLKSEIKSQSVLTEEERTDAIELGLILETPQAIEGSVSSTTQSSNALGEKQLENTDKVNMQGVATTTGNEGE